MANAPRGDNREAQTPPECKANLPILESELWGIGDVAPHLAIAWPTGRKEAGAMNSIGVSPELLKAHTGKRSNNLALPFRKWIEGKVVEGEGV